METRVTPLFVDVLFFSYCLCITLKISMLNEVSLLKDVLIDGCCIVTSIYQKRCICITLRWMRWEGECHRVTCSSLEHIRRASGMSNTMNPKGRSLERKEYVL